jgi:flagella basal body P-ring formation protein FlgA
MHALLLAVVLACALPVVPAAAQETWHAARALRPGEVIGEADLLVRAPARPLARALPADRPIAGLEVRRRVAAGRALTEADVGPRLVVQANAPVRMIWAANGIRLEMAGRALEGGGAGETIRVLNTATSRTVRGTVQPDGSVLAEATP